MVFEHRSGQNSVRAAPLPIVKDHHHSSHRYRKQNGFFEPMPSNGQQPLNNSHKLGDSNNNNDNNSKNYHQKLINLFKGNNQQPTNGQHTASKPIAICKNGNKSHHSHYDHHHQQCRMDSLPETPPIESSLFVAGEGRKHENGPVQGSEQYQYRQSPLTIGEYESEFRESASDLKLIERIFYGGIDSNKLRAALWPHIFGLVKHRGRFIKRSPNLSRGASAAIAANGSFSRLPSSAPPSIAREPPSNRHVTNGHSTNGSSNHHNHQQTNGRTTNGTTNSSSFHQDTTNLYPTSNSLTKSTNGQLASIINGFGGGNNYSKKPSNGCTAMHSNGLTNGHASIKTNGQLVDRTQALNGHRSAHRSSLFDSSGSTSPNNHGNRYRASAATVKSERRHQRETLRQASGSGNGKSLDDEQFSYIEHEDNLKRWCELERLYLSYESQWKSITADQESRFAVFRERKALIERDVIRSDRTHPFYADSSTNLNNFTALLMTYMMYDFDIGYLQGMSDLAAPILYVYQGDLVKSFWVFVAVMKLFRGNFEQSQRTIHFQLNCLYRLIKLTEPKLAYHLRDNDCSNCFFVFRCIVCQFKRELMKSRSSSNSPTQRTDPDEAYAEVLNLWDTIWSVERRHELLTASGQRRSLCQPAIASMVNGASGSNSTGSQQLSETEKFILSLCLSLITRERDHILKCLDASEIHQHFINPHLTRNFDQFVDQAYEVYQYLNSDCDLQLLVRGADRLSGATSSDLSPICNDLLATSTHLQPLDEPPDDDAEPDTYDLLKDYLIISPTAYNIPLLPAQQTYRSQQQQQQQSTTSNNLSRTSASLASGACDTTDHRLMAGAQATSPSAAVSPRRRTSKSLAAANRYGVSQRSWDQFLHRDECLA